MDDQRVDFAYSLWGAPLLLDENRFTAKMNPVYGEGLIQGLNFGEGIFATVTSYICDFYLEEPVVNFKDQLFFFGKVLEGTYYIKNEDNQFLFHKGDIFAISGNYVLSGEYSFKEKSVVVAVLGYHQDIIQGLKEHHFYSDKIVDILNDQDLKTGIILSQTHEIDQWMQNLYTSILQDDRWTAYVKMMDLFHFFMSNYHSKIYKKNKTYTEQQVETVKKVKEFLDDHVDQYYSMPELSRMFSISLSRLQSIFEHYYKCSPYRYHLNARLERANDLIIHTDIKINTIAKLVGFNSYNKFVQAYKNKYACNPSKNRVT